MGLNKLRRVEHLQSALQAGRHTITVASTISAKNLLSRVANAVRTAFALPQLAVATVA